jgi:flagellar protein FlbT
MLIHLKRGEKLYVNGAVLRVDRRTSLEFLNDVSFLLENHVMQAEEAKTPLKQLYFVVQTMLMDPANAAMTAELYKHLSHRLRTTVKDEPVLAAIDQADRKVLDSRYFDALKIIRGCYAAEQALFGPAAEQKADSLEEEAA